MSESKRASLLRRAASWFLLIVLGLCFAAVAAAKEGAPGWYAQQDWSFRFYWTAILFLLAWAIFRVGPLALLGVEERTIQMIRGRPFWIMVLGAILLMVGIVLVVTWSFLVGNALGVVGLLLLLGGVVSAFLFGGGRPSSANGLEEVNDYDSVFATESGSGKVIQLTVDTCLVRGFVSKRFGFVEGGVFSYEATVHNIGNESVGSDTDTGDIHALEFIWKFPNGQASRDRVEFPRNLRPGESHTFSDERHEVMSPGYALLYVKVWRAGAGLDIAVKDEAGNLVPTDELEWGPAAPDFGTTWALTPLSQSFGFFRAKSRGEVYRAVLIIVAMVALIINAVFSAYNAIG